MIHHDIKAANIMVTSGNNFKITLVDLDFSKKNKSDDLLKIPHKKVHRNKLGTKNHMAPELFSTNAYKGEPVDIFAIGHTLFTMFA